MRFLLLIILWVLTPQGLQIGEVFYNNQRIKIMKLNLNNPAFLQSASNVSGEIVPAGNPYYVKGREDNTTVTFVFPEYTQVSSDGVSYADAQETHVINAGEKLYIKYEPITSQLDITVENWNAFSIDKEFDAGGVMEPMIVDLSSQDIAFRYAYFSMEELPIVDAKKLIIDITGETDVVCLFRNCTSLVDAPELPATTLTSDCYSYMFKGCTSLVNAPELPATTLAEACYQKMFYGCTSLVNAPELPATTLAESCYESMFNNCTSLRTITCLAVNNTANRCTFYWLLGVAPTGTFTKAADVQWETNESGIPVGWTVIEQ